MTTSTGRTLKLFLVDGVPNGLLTAEIMNWTGHVITGPRSRLSELIQRPESRRTGVYFLVGPDSGAGIGTQVYIGETDDVAQRLTTHNRPEADRSDMEFFLEQIRTLLPVLGLDFLRETPQSSAPDRAVPTLPIRLPNVASQPPAIPGLSAPTSPVFVCDVKRHDISARGQEINGEFVVFKGSRTRGEWEGAGSTYTELFKELARSGVLASTVDGRHREFTRDYAFSSPSAAAAVVSGRSANGRIQWMTEVGGQTYGAWQEARVNAMLAELDSTLPMAGVAQHSAVDAPTVAPESATDVH